MKKKFKIGDQVIKKSGGLPMTIDAYIKKNKTTILPPLKRKYIKCSYFDVYGKKSVVVPEDSLEPVFDRNRSMRSVSNNSIRNNFLLNKAY